MRRLSTVTLAASSYDLTDLATVKDELQIPTGDTTRDPWLGRTITQISTAVGQYTNRVFQIETVQDVFYPTRGVYPYSGRGGAEPLQVSRWPILGLSFSVPTTDISPATGTTLYAADDRIIVGMPVSIPMDAGEFVLSTFLDFLGSIPTLATSLAVTVPSGTVVTYGPIVTLTDSAGLVTYLSVGTDYLIDQDRGWLIRLNSTTKMPIPWETSKIIAVAYQAGYATVPADVVDATLQMVTQRFQARGRDPYLKSQTQPGLGDQTFWVGNLPGVSSGMPQEIMELFDYYRIPVVA